eukprot:364325-Chlamydomonas_euryale.AAC.3
MAGVDDVVQPFLVCERESGSAVDPDLGLVNGALWNGCDLAAEDMAGVAPAKACVTVKVVASGYLEHPCAPVPAISCVLLGPCLLDELTTTSRGYCWPPAPGILHRLFLRQRHATGMLTLTLTLTQISYLDDCCVVLLAASAGILVQKQGV